MPVEKIEILTTSGTSILGESDQPLTLEDKQFLVGGYIEPVKLFYKGKERIMWVNEEGLLKNLPHNLKASTLTDQVIVGNVFIEL